jgi:hypothetical protein
MATPDPSKATPRNAPKSDPQGDARAHAGAARAGALDDLTWAALLGRWTALAQTSLALPATPEGDRWRQSVPSIVALQAVCMALGDDAGLARLAPDERALRVDRAGLLIAHHTAMLGAIWRTTDGPTAAPVALHPELASLLDDARAAHARAGSALVRPSSNHPGPST